MTQISIVSSGYTEFTLVSEIRGFVLCNTEAKEHLDLTTHIIETLDVELGQMNTKRIKSMEVCFQPEIYLRSLPPEWKIYEDSTGSIIRPFAIQYYNFKVTTEAIGSGIREGRTASIRF